MGQQAMEAGRDAENLQQCRDREGGYRRAADADDEHQRARGVQDDQRREKRDMPKRKSRRFGGLRDRRHLPPLIPTPLAQHGLIAQKLQRSIVVEGRRREESLPEIRAQLFVVLLKFYNNLDLPGVPEQNRGHN
jgi:hypothetical protein